MNVVWIIIIIYAVTMTIVCLIQKSMLNLGEKITEKYRAETENLKIHAEDERTRLFSQISFLRDENTKLANALNKIFWTNMQNRTHNHVRNSPNISKDTIDAVCYAMKKAHPDNGGKEEDFIKFKKLHDELTSRK